MLKQPKLTLITSSIVLALALCTQPFTSVSPQAKPTAKAPVSQVTAAPMTLKSVRTTAYTHTESDHIQYGAKSAVGTRLSSGKIRSAAADWSIYPLGTVFQIKGDASVYIVDDYGSALVGTRTIDIYQPSTRLMNLWGTRRVDIQIVRWGSLSKSLAVLRPRAGKASHVREMIYRIQSQQRASAAS